MFLLAKLDLTEQCWYQARFLEQWLEKSSMQLITSFFKETLDFGSFLFYLLINLTSGEWMLRLLIQAIILAGQALV